MKEPLQVPNTKYEGMLSHLRDVYPLEGCGLLGGLDGRVTRLYPVTNILASPYNYEMDPRQQLRAFDDLESAGLELLAIFHSHPHGPEQPSATDVARAYYPDTIQLIVSFRDPASPSVRAFTIVEGQVNEVPLRVV